MLSIVSYYLTVIVLNLSGMSNVFQPQLSHLFFNILKTPRAWMILLCTPLLAVLPDIYFRAYKNLFSNDPVDFIISHRVKSSQTKTKSIMPQQRTTAIGTKGK